MSGAASPVYDANITLQQLETVLTPLPYADKSRVARDVIGLIRNTNSLACKVGQLIHPNGRSETLLQLLGTTPIDYKGAVYNIPINIWIVDAYPHRPPTCYVTPTKDMRIKLGHMHVDHFGMVYLPYLNQWNAQNSNLLEMVTMMSSVFSTDPPVFKVPSGGGGNPQDAKAAQVQGQPQGQPQGNYAQQPAFSSSGSNSSYSPSSNNSPALSSPQQRMPPSYPSPSGNSPISPASGLGVSPSHGPSSSQYQDPRALRKNQLITTITNKLRQQLQDDLSLKTLLMDDLLQQQAQIDSHGKQLEERLATLKQESAALTQANTTLAQRNQELTAWLAQNEKREVVDVDKLAYVKDTWSKQLLDNVALDFALEDAYYLLDRALADDRIDLQTYTKQLRNLSRKQFYARALVAQIIAAQQQAAGGAQPNGMQSY